MVKVYHSVLNSLKFSQCAFKMDKSDKRRQARLQGRHIAHLPKSSISEEQETLPDQSKYQNNVENTFSNDVSNQAVVYPVDTSCNIDKNQEMQVVSSSERLRDDNKTYDRKRSQRYNSNPRQRGAFRSSRRGNAGNRSDYNSQSYHVSSDGNIDGTVQCLNAHFPKRSSIPEEQETSPDQSRCQNNVENTFNNDVSSKAVLYPVDTSHNIDENREMKVISSTERLRDDNKTRGRKRSQRYNSNPRQRGAFHSSRRGGAGNSSDYNSQSCHISSDENIDGTVHFNAHFPKTSSIPEEQETSPDQSRCQNNVENTFNNDVSSQAVVYPVDTSHNIDQNREMQAISSSERLRDDNKTRGRKRLQRYNSNPRQRSAFHSSRGGCAGNRSEYNSQSCHISSDGNINETMQSLNGLSVNVDDTVNTSFVSRETHKHQDQTRRYIPKNSTHYMPQHANNRIKFYADAYEQSYNSDPQSKHNINRGRNANRYVRNKPRFDRTHYSTDESIFKETNVSRTYNNERGAEIQRSVSFDSCKLNCEAKNDSCSDVNVISSVYQKQNIGNNSRFVYEETDQAEKVIQKTKGPIPLNIIGWHKMVKRNPEEKDSFLYFKPDFLGEEKKECYYQHLRESIKWQEKEVVIRGEKYMQPRLVAWYGPLPYSYSNAVLESNCEFPPVILDMKERIENILRDEQRDVAFNSVLLNMYRDGKDSVAWHSDDELSMGIHPTIASISLGETRRFEMKQKQDRKVDGPHQPESEEFVIHLTSGSLLVMDGAMQQYWLHRVPKEFHDRDCRINLTFRTVYLTEEK